MQRYAKLCGQRFGERPESNVPYDTLGFLTKTEMLHCSRLLQELKDRYLSIDEFHFLTL